MQILPSSGDRPKTQAEGGGDGQTKVLVAIVGFRNAEDTKACVRALARSTHTNFIVSICENGGSDAYDALLDALQDIVEFSADNANAAIEATEVGRSGILRPVGQPIQVIQARENLGFAAGVNLTLKRFAPVGGWSAVWLLNPDTEPDPDALSALVARSRESGASIIGSRLVLSSSQQVQLYGGRWRPWLARGLNIGLGSPKDAPVNIETIENQMTYVNGASLFATRAFVNEAGLMDEQFFLYCEEVDWCMRVANKKIAYAHDAIVYHNHGGSIGSNRVGKQRSSLSVYLAERNKLLLSKRHFPKQYPLILATTLVLILQYLAQRAFRNGIVALRGWYAGVRGEVGPPRLFHQRDRKV